MSNENRSVVGILVAGALLAAIVAGAVGFELLRGAPPSSGPTASAPAKQLTRLSVDVGGEKMGFIKDERVTAILADKYGLQVDANKSGSIDMVTGATAGKDALWPSTQVATAFFQRNGGTSKGVDNVFNSPLVVCSWDVVTTALQQNGLVTQREGVSYLDLPKLSAAIKDGKAWTDLGLKGFNGKVKVITTDPNRSSSGLMFAGLLAGTLNGGDPPDETTVAPLLPVLQAYFGRLGSMDASSSDLFEKFLGQGAGAYPMAVVYESQLTQFINEHPEAKEQLRTRVTTLYPEPTAWSEHPIIALTDNGKKLVEAMKDPEIQQIAARDHGFRSVLSTVQGNVPQVTSTLQMPAPAVMTKILEAVRQ